MISVILEKLKQGNVFIEASAGTGKTYTIVEIVTKLLEDNHKISRLAIITFTEKAAGELQDRIRKSLETKLQASLPETQREHFSQEIEDLPFANIGTIHSFCRNLLSYDLEASQFFSFKIEERNVESRVQKAFEVFLDKKQQEAIQNHEEEKFIEFFLEFELEELSKFCTEMIYKSGYKRIHPKELTLENLNSEFQDLLKSILNRKPDSPLKSYQNFEVLTVLEKLKEDKILNKDLSLNKNKNRYLGETEFETWSKAFQEFHLRLQYYKQQEKLRSFLEFVNEWIQFYEEYQQKENFISTDDIIILTEKMLKNNPKIKRTLSENFDYIIVDECQDTDPRQFSILSLLVNSDSNNKPSNYKLPKLILVGDKKQSIYRFRNADLATVNYYLNTLIPKENILRLDTSFRSRSALNEFYNQFFQEFSSNPNFKNFNFDYSSVKTGRNDELSASKSSAVFLGLTNFTEEEKPNAKRIRTSNAELIVNFIKEIYNNYLIFDKYTQEKRKISFSDIAILAHSNRDLKEIQEFLLLHKIPCSTYKENNYYEESLVAALAYMLHAIENPYDTQSFLLCLGSPLFLIPTPILTKLSNEDSLNYYESALQNTKEYDEINKIFRLFYEAHTKRYTQSASFIIQEILEKMNTIPRLASGFYGRKNLTLLYQFYDIINELQYDKNMGFGEIAREMIRRVQKEMEGEKRLDYEEREETQDTVKLMTIHASKGLEFPVCILFTVFRTSSYLNRPKIFKYKQENKDLEFNLEFKFKTNEEEIRTLNYEAARKQDEQEENEEEARRIYVACTRAREYLFLPLNFSVRITNFSESLKSLLKKNSSFIQNVTQGSDPVAKLWEVTSLKEFNLIQTSSKKLLNAVNKEEHEERRKKALESIKKVAQWKFVSYSRLHLKDLKVQEVEKKIQKQNEFTDSYVGRQFGLLTHKVLELFPFERLNSRKDWKIQLEQICKETYDEFGLDSNLPTYSLETLIELTYNALVYHYQIENKKVSIINWEYIQKEKKFYANGEKLGDWILGTWDLLFMFQNKYYILDWKTDQNIGDSLQSHCEQEYKYQFYLYSYAMLLNLKQIYQDLEISELYENYFGGMLFVFLRHLQDGKGVYFVKPNLKEIQTFVNQE